MRQVFILSPAKTSGERAQLLYNPAARFALARSLRSPQGVELGEVFSFLSGLYFRGKLTYARTFTAPPPRVPGVLVITTFRGLLPAETPVTLEDLRAFSEVPIEPSDPRYLGPLTRDAELIRESIGRRCQVVFLGSVSSKRYVEPLLTTFGDRLLFPPTFLGRGDMSRGSVLLRAAAAKQPLEHRPLAGAVRHGKRPAKLPPRSWGYQILGGRTNL